MNLLEQVYTSSFNFTSVREHLDQIHPIVNNSLRKNRQRARDAASRGVLPIFLEGDFVLVSREDILKAENLSCIGGDQYISSKPYHITCIWCKTCETAALVKLMPAYFVSTLILIGILRR